MNLTIAKGSIVSMALIALTISVAAFAQNPTPSTETLRKANARPAEPARPKAEPFDGAPVDKMLGQCVTLDTEQGVIVIEVLPHKAPESSHWPNILSTGAPSNG